ncbi:hypothetical protein F4677DRAFT_314798 [Hypoxylon crocopeplum]|nr:hypothetical protein F4677DRAFT_314798 [Hypoxylon crocopeplum]
MGWTYNTPQGTPTEGPRIAAVTTTFTGFSLILVCLRTYVRGWIVKAFGNDDWMIMISWVGTCVYSTCTVVQTKYGLGLERLDDMPPENVYNFGLVQYIGAPFYVVGIWGFKMSLLLCYLRFFQGRYYTAAIVVAVVCTMAHIAFACVFLFLCTPISKQWDPDVTWGHCAQAVPFYLSFSSLTICFDLMVIGLPFPVLVKSKIPRRRKAALLVLFALGIFVTIIQIIRIQTISSLANYLDSANAIQWSIIESNMGITITCIPTLAPLIRYFSEKTRTGTGSASKKPNSRYALHTWGNGIRAFGSHGDHEADTTKIPRGDSTERILDTEGFLNSTDAAMMKQKMRRSDTPESGEIEEEQLGVPRKGSTSVSV